MQTLDLSDKKVIEAGCQEFHTFSANNKYSWKQDLQESLSQFRKSFNWAFGVVLPIILFAIDPILFETDPFCICEARLASIKPLVYLISFSAIFVLMAWLIWRDKLKLLGGLLAGLFLINGIVFFSIGIALIQIAWIGVTLSILPFLTSFVFFRNSFLAFQSAKFAFTKRVLVWILVLTSLYGISVPLVINSEINSIINDIKAGDAQTVRQNGKYLYFVSPLVNAKFLVFEYRNELDKANTERKEALAEVYKKLTGLTIE